MLNDRSLRALSGVHPDLVAVVLRAAENESVPFIVTEGLRTPERQAVLVASGRSRTLRSLNLDGRAVDLCVSLPGGGVSWERGAYKILALSVKAAAHELGIPVEWGGEAFGPAFVDGPHFQLNPHFYPAAILNLQPEGQVTQT